MSDPALSRPPFIPEGTFRCSLCLDVFPVAEAWTDAEGQAWDSCRVCGDANQFEALLSATHPEEDDDG